MPGHEPSFVSTSLWQTPQACTLMLTCPTPGLGISRSTIPKSAPGLVMCATFIGVIANLVVTITLLRAVTSTDFVTLGREPPSVHCENHLLCTDCYPRGFRRWEPLSPPPPQKRLPARPGGAERKAGRQCTTRLGFFTFSDSFCSLRRHSAIRRPGTVLRKKEGDESIRAHKGVHRFPALSL